MRDLVTRLESAIDGTSSLGQSLAALTQLNPKEAVVWLLAHEDIVRRSCSKRFLSQLLDWVVDPLLTLHATPSNAPLIELARQYVDMFGGDAAARVARRFPSAEHVATLRAFVTAVLQREPKHPGLLRAACDLAIQASDAPEAHRLLAQLARVDSGQATVHRVYRTRARLPTIDTLPVRVALLSSFTVDILVAYVDLELRGLGLKPEVYVAPFNSWARDVIDAKSDLRRFNPEIAFLAVSIDDLVPELAGTPSSTELANAGTAAVERVVTLAHAFAEWSEAPLVVHSFHSAYRGPLGVLEGRNGPTRSRWLANTNARLADGLQSLPHAYLLDMNELLLHRPSGLVDNPKMRSLAGMRLTDQALGEVARAYARFVAPLKGLSRKCVVVDLDNTLWGGTVGEDGPHGIKLGNTSPGIEFQDLQRYLHALTQTGVLLAINSHNNPADALEVIRSHEGMILHEDAFSAIRINWEPKPDNMISIAEELGIGIDSMVFLDDNPNERERMRQFLPEVLVPDLPADTTLYRHTVEGLPQLQRLFTTDEDQSRVAMYQAKRQREKKRATTHSIEEYLHSLDIEVTVGSANDATLPRICQLFERTNQFNLTTRRHDAGVFVSLMRDPNWHLYSLRARDRFGDHGLVAVALVHATPDCYVLDSFLMSCRVIGYGIETTLLAVIEEDARVVGTPQLVGEYIETKKNAPARDFYARHGFKKAGTDGDTVCWRLELNEHKVERPGWVKVVVADEA